MLVSAQIAKGGSRALRSNANRMRADMRSCDFIFLRGPTKLIKSFLLRRSKSIDNTMLHRTHLHNASAVLLASSLALALSLSLPQSLRFPILLCLSVSRSVNNQKHLAFVVFIIVAKQKTSAREGK